MFDSNCCFLTWIQVSQETDKVVGVFPSLNFPKFVVIHTVKGFSIVNKVEVNVFLEFPYFSYDPTNVGNLISGSSAFSKTSLNIWKFSVHILLKPILENFEHYFTNMLHECNFVCRHCLHTMCHRHCPSLGLKWKLTFSSPVVTVEFSKYFGILNAKLLQHHLLRWHPTPVLLPGKIPWTESLVGCSPWGG